MLNRTVYIVALAFALLFAQQGAAWHALSHLNSVPGHSQPDQKLPQGEPCAKCAVFSQLGAACPAAAPQIDLATFHGVLPLHAATQFDLLSPQPYQSRAPPHFV